jgi:hypothetical protein
MTEQTQTPPASPPAAPPPAAPPAAPPAPPAAPPGAGDPWFSRPEYGLGDDDKAYFATKTYATPADAFKAFRTFETLARDRNALVGPQPGKELEWDGWEKLGWTPDATKYQAPVFDKFKDDPDYAGLHGAIVKAGHGSRVPPAQLKLIADAVGAHLDTMNQQSDAATAREKQAMEAQLRTKWGAQTEPNIELAKRAARASGLAEADQGLMEALMGWPQFIAHFHKIGSMMSEDQFVAGGGSAGTSPASARAELDRQNADPEFVKSLSDARHPMHQANTAQRRALFEAMAAKG